ncbi:MAG: S1 RNA-binding domain-containing protein [Lachnospiraceae bacterium]|nr:S1 RNA-binding domain-containing protein [Lachnospiraceae bacterium]
MKLGVVQTLIIVKHTDFGVYLGESIDADERVLLPIKQVPKGSKRGDSLDVFLYRDSKDRLIATTNKPKLTLNQCGMLRVKEVTNIGAFLDMGLERDVLLPYKEQTTKVREGREYPVCLYEDKTGRLAATMRLYHRLKLNPPYKADDHIEGIVYEISDEHGAYIMMDYEYTGLLPKKEVHRNIRVGDSLTLRVVQVRDNGKVDLSLSEKAYVQMDTDATNILEVINSYDGVLPFNDKASPKVIEDEFGISKAAFKRAVGRLLKQGKIEIKEDSIISKGDI